MNTPIWSMGLVVLATVVGSFGTILLKQGAKHFDLKKPLQVIKNYKLVGGLSIFLFSSVIFITALRAGELSVLYPLVALSYIWVTILSKIFLNEKINLYKWIGIAFVILGVALIGIGS